MPVGQAVAESGGPAGAGEEAGTDADEGAAAGGDAGGAASVGPVTWMSCGRDLECGAVAVPLDHDQPDGATITIQLVRVPASGERLGTIFVNPGGPGGSGLDFVANGFRLDADTMARYDLIGFDPRGVGASGSPQCRLDRTIGPLPDFSPDDPAEREQLEAHAREIAERCAELDGELLAHLTTDDVARDLDLLRAAVGDPVLHYYGFSYGTLIGLVYADLFPERVGHVVLDGVVDPTASLSDLLTQQTAAFEQAFATLDEACSRGLACPPGGAALAFDQVLAAVDGSPIGQVGPAEVEAAALGALYDERAWPTLTAALSEALGGDYSGIESLSDSFLGSVEFSSYAAVVCTDTPRPADPAAWDAFAAALAAEYPRFGAAVANELLACAHWPVTGSPERGPVVAAGAAPILVIGNTGDPATPLANAEDVAASLEQASLVVLEADRHTAYRASSCVQDLVRDYFVDDAVPLDGTRC